MSSEDYLDRLLKQMMGDKDPEQEFAEKPEIPYAAEETPVEEPVIEEPSFEEPTENIIPERV
jgi:hypothetical protein